MRTLKNVRYIPGLSKSLISISILDKDSHWYSVENGVMRISHGSLILMKGMLYSTLYALQGSTVVESAAVSIGFENMNL